MLQDGQRTGDLSSTSPNHALSLDPLAATLIEEVRGPASLHSLTLRTDNLFDVFYREATSRIKDFAPNPGRNLALVYRVLF